MKASASPAARKNSPHRPRRRRDHRRAPGPETWPPPTTTPCSASPHATTAEVRKAERGKALEQHPASGDEESFRLLSERDVLSDADRRKYYDRTGRPERTAEDDFLDGPARSGNDAAGAAPRSASTRHEESHANSRAGCGAVVRRPIRWRRRALVVLSACRQRVYVNLTWSSTASMHCRVAATPSTRPHESRRRENTTVSNQTQATARTWSSRRKVTKRQEEHRRDSYEKVLLPRVPPHHHRVLRPSRRRPTKRAAQRTEVHYRKLPKHLDWKECPSTSGVRRSPCSSAGGADGRMTCLLLCRYCGDRGARHVVIEGERLGRAPLTRWAPFLPSRSGRKIY